MLLVFYCSLSSVCFGFLVLLSLQLPLCRVVGYLQVFGANEVGVVRVLTQSAEHINIVVPKGNVRDVVAPAKCDFIGLLMLVYLPCSAGEVVQMLGASRFHQGLGSL